MSIGKGALATAFRKSLRLSKIAVVLRRDIVVLFYGSGQYSRVHTDTLPNALIVSAQYQLSAPGTRCLSGLKVSIPFHNIRHIMSELPCPGPGGGPGLISAIINWLLPAFRDEP